MNHTDDLTSRSEEQEPTTSARPPLPPFTLESAILVRVAEDAWNSRSPETVALAYTKDARWRNRSEFLSGEERRSVAFLKRKWERELEYRQIEELWAFEGDRITFRFAYEWHNETGDSVLWQ